MRKKCLALLLAVAMLASLLVSPAMALDYPDAQNSWAKSSIDRWSDAGIVGGDDQGKINPDQALRRAELAVILVRLLGLTQRAPMGTFTDVPAGAWYEDAILKCAAAGIMQGWNGHVDPLDNITREEAITMVGRALGVKSQSGQGLDQFLDAGRVQSYAQPYMASLTALGILKGVGDGTRVAPQDFIDRASALSLLDKAIGAYVTQPGNVTVNNANTFVVVNVKNAKESDVVTVSGVAAGVAVTIGNTADVTMSALTAGTVKVDAPVDVVVANSSDLGDMTLNAIAALNVEKGAEVDGVNVTSAAANTAITNAGVIGTVSANAAATIDNQGTVSNLTANANGVVIKGTDAVKTVTTNGASVNSSGAKAPSPASTVTSGGSSTGGRPSRPGSSSSSTTKDFTVVPGNLGVIDESSELPGNGLATGYKAEGKTTDDGKNVTVSLTADTLKAHKRSVDPEDAEPAWWIGFGMPIDTGKTYTYVVNGTPVTSISGRVQEVDGKSYNTVYFSLDEADANKDVTYTVIQAGDTDTVIYKVTIKVAKLLDKDGNLVAPITPVTPEVDKTALNNAITAAQTAVDAITVDTAAENVPQGTEWVTAEAKADYQSAIDTAQGVANDENATQDEVDAAEAALADATATFEAAKQEGTKEEGGEPEEVDKSELKSAITAANGAKTGVVSAENGENVLNTKKWVTADEMKALNDAIADAQTVVNDASATEEAVEQAVTALNAAVDAFNAAKKDGEKEPDPGAPNTEALETAIADANAAIEGLVGNDAAEEDVAKGTEYYNTADLNAYKAAIAAAQAVVDKTDATQDEVDAAVADLATATTAFEGAKKVGTKEESVPVNKGALTTAIADANAAIEGLVGNDAAEGDVAKGTEYYNTADLNAYKAAIDAAQAVVDNESATQDEVAAAVADLATATTAFEGAKKVGTKEESVPVNKGALTAAIADANAAIEGLVGNDAAEGDVAKGTEYYNTADLNAYKAAIDAAQAVVDNESATQDEVAAAVADLATATATFGNAKKVGTKEESVPVTVNREALTTAIADANAAKTGVETSENGSDVEPTEQWVTSEQMTTLENAITAAQTVLDNESATQEDVDQAVTTLNAAVDAFNAAKKDGEKEPDPEEGEGPETDPNEGGDTSGTTEE